MSDYAAVVNIARCREHGLHGCRSRCFECERTVEQVPMVPAVVLQVFLVRVQRAIVARSWCRRASTTGCLLRPGSTPMADEMLTLAITFDGAYDDFDGIAAHFGLDADALRAAYAAQRFRSPLGLAALIAPYMAAVTGETP